MTVRVVVIGEGILADTVVKQLGESNLCVVTRESDISTRAQGLAESRGSSGGSGGSGPSGDTVGTADSDDSADAATEFVTLAITLDDGWRPSQHVMAEKLFRRLGIPWLRAFVAFGNGYVGPLIRDGQQGCSHCADLRLIMADEDRRQLLQLRGQFAADGGVSRDAWATRTALRHLAILVANQTEAIINKNLDSILVDSHMLCTDLQTLQTTRHFILPVASCTTCNILPDDAPTNTYPIEPTPKVQPGSFRAKSVSTMAASLTHDYLDQKTGLFNTKVHDLITPFAAVSVNLPLLMGDEGTSGRATSYPECEPVAILEGLERFCGLEPRGKRTVVYDSYANLHDCALNPETVGLHRPDQYKQPHFPFQPFDKHVPLGWVWAYSLTKQRPILVPERYAYYSLGFDGGFVYETSNGCAIGGTLVEAIFHGILEVIERDAFLMTWYARLPLPVVNLDVHPDTELQWLIQRVRAVTGYELHFYNATMENGVPTAFVIAKNQRPDGLNLLCSAGAHLDGTRAIQGAIQETAGMLLRFDEKLEAERGRYLGMLRESSLVQHMEDHSMLYGLSEAQERLDFLLCGERSVQTMDEAFRWNTQHLDLAEDLADVVETFRRQKMDVIVVNQTSPEIARNGLSCVKVIIPGMLPMTFGQQFVRLENLPRVLTVPMQLGYTERPLTMEELNPYPHPFP